MIIVAVRDSKERRERIQESEREIECMHTS